MKVTIDGHVIEGTAAEIKEYFELLGVEFPVKAEQIADPKEVEEETPKFKTGDKVRNNRTGEIVEVYAYQPKERTYGEDAGQTLFSPEKGFTYIEGNSEFWDFIEDYELVTEVIEESTPKFKEGDRVKILAEGEFGGVDVGEIGTVAISYVDDDEYNVRVDGDDGHDYFRPRDLELVTQEPYKPTEGDIVVITGNTNFSRNKVGDIGKVGEVNPAGTAKVDVPSNPKTLDVNGNWTKFSEMRPATEGEKAQYEKALKVAKGSEKMAKIGRKPGVFKKGDIVRGERYSDSSAKFLGIVEDISGSMIGVRSGDSRYHAAEKAKSELIAPVESRVDTE